MASKYLPKLATILESSKLSKNGESLLETFETKSRSTSKLLEQKNPKLSSSLNDSSLLTIYQNKHKSLYALSSSTIPVSTKDFKHTDLPVAKSNENTGRNKSFENSSYFTKQDKNSENSPLLQKTSRSIVCLPGIELPKEPFEKTRNCIKIPKRFTSNTETFNNSWKDPEEAKLCTSGIESVTYNILNYGKGLAPKKINELKPNNPKLFNRIKSIAQYADINRPTYRRTNQDYINIVNKFQGCFNKPSSLCAKGCDTAKTYGPLFKLF